MVENFSLAFLEKAKIRWGGKKKFEKKKKWNHRTRKWNTKMFPKQPKWNVHLTARARKNSPVTCCCWNPGRGRHLFSWNCSALLPGISCQHRSPCLGDKEAPNSPAGAPNLRGQRIFESPHLFSPDEVDAAAVMAGDDDSFWEVIQGSENPYRPSNII